MPRAFTLTAVDNGNGTITITPKYDNDGVTSVTSQATFINSMKPGTLRITKNVENETSNSSNTSFNFTVTLTSDDDTQVLGEYAWVRNDGTKGYILTGKTLQLRDGAIC